MTIYTPEVRQKILDTENELRLLEDTTPQEKAYGYSLALEVIISYFPIEIREFVQETVIERVKEILSLPNLQEFDEILACHLFFLDEKAKMFTENIKSYEKILPITSEYMKVLEIWYETPF